MRRVIWLNPMPTWDLRMPHHVSRAEVMLLVSLSLHQVLLSVYSVSQAAWTTFCQQCFDALLIAARFSRFSRLIAKAKTHYGRGKDTILIQISKINPWALSLTRSGPWLCERLGNIVIAIHLHPHVAGTAGNILGFTRVFWKLGLIKSYGSQKVLILLEVNVLFQTLAQTRYSSTESNRNVLINSSHLPHCYMALGVDGIIHWIPWAYVFVSLPSCFKMLQRKRLAETCQEEERKVRWVILLIKFG